jgi:hypothetical protein
LSDLCLSARHIDRQIGAKSLQSELRMTLQTSAGTKGGLGARRITEQSPFPAAAPVPYGANIERFFAANPPRSC